VKGISYNIGDAVPLVYTISATATVALTVTDPDGTTSTPATTQGGSPPAVTYTANVLATKAGTWLYSFVATGAVTDAEDGQFYVQPAATANVYTTLPELKAALSIPATNTDYDDRLQDAILVASRTVDGDCGRHFYRVAETRTLQPGRDPYLLKLGPYNDLASLTTLKTDTSGDGTFETTWQTSDYQLLCADGSPNVNAGPEPRPYRQIRAVGTQTFPVLYGWNVGRADRVQLAGVWGWPQQVPGRIRQATQMAALEIFKMPEAPFGAVGFSELGIIRVRDNPKYLSLIADYRIMPVPVA
jgi:hypothetical protein